jgi:replicative DNA helicase
VIASCLQDQIAVDVAADRLSPKDFYFKAHEIIFEHILKLCYSRTSVDVVTISDSLQLSGKLEDIGGAEFLAELIQKVPQAANIEHHCKIVIEKAQLRFCLYISGEIKRAVETKSSVDELIDLINNHTMKLVTGQRAGYQHIAEHLHKFYNDLSKRVEGETFGIKTYIEPLDKKLISIEPGELVVVAARPGSGKTELGLTIAKNNAERGIPVGFVSLEMKGSTLSGRIVAAEAKVNKAKFRDGKLTDAELTRISKKIDGISGYSMYIDEQSNLTVHQIIARAKTLINAHGIKLLVVDYLGLIKTHNVYLKKHDAISDMINLFLSFGKDTDVPVILISQLNREQEKGKYRLPILSDLRDSGEIENGAHIVIFLDRPEKSHHFENKTETKITQNGKVELFPIKYLSAVRIAKFREVGEVPETIPLYFNMNLQRYVDYNTHLENLNEDPAFDKKIPLPNESGHFEQDDPF